MKEFDKELLEVIQNILEKLELIGKHDKLPTVYKTCFTHSSTRRKNNNEKLEFIGDSVLNFVITNLLIKKYPNLDENQLSKKRAYLISRESCYEVAKNLNLDQCLFMSFGERKNSGTMHKNNLACTMEALIGAIYLNHNINKATDFIEKHWNWLFEGETKDYKTQLQEFCHKKFKAFPIYEVVKISGTEHQPLFEVKASLPDGSMSEIATGSNKKLAEKNAACIIIHKIFK